MLARQLGELPAALRRAAAKASVDETSAAPFAPPASRAPAGHWMAELDNLLGIVTGTIITCAFLAGIAVWQTVRTRRAGAACSAPVVGA